MQARHAILGLLLVLALVVGSFPTTATHVAHDPLGGWPDPLITGHNHASATHRPSTPNVVTRAVGEGSWPHPRVTYTPTFGELARLGPDHIVNVAALHGFSIWDVSLRDRPVQRSFMPYGELIMDAKGTADGKVLFVGTQNLFNDAFGTNDGIAIFDTTFKDSPLLVGFQPVVGGCHMLAVHDDVLACAPFGDGVHLFRIVRSPAATLLPVGTYSPFHPLALPVLDAKLCDWAAGTMHCRGNVHDMTIQLDPLTGRRVMTVSYMAAGVHIVDLADPANPLMLASWEGQGAGALFEESVHTAMMTEVGGRRIVLAIEEYVSRPAIHILDATDLGAVVYLESWYPKLGPLDNDFSAHNFQVANGRVYMANYHGPIWVVDITPVVAGGHAYALGYGTVGDGQGESWDVLLIDGRMYTTAGEALYVMHYTGDVLGDPSANGFA